MGSTVSFRDVDDVAFREFKAVVARQGLRMGEAVTAAFKLFAKQAEAAPVGRMPLLGLKPVSYGKGSAKLSASVDAVLYGWER